MSTKRKKVLLVVIDALASPFVSSAMTAGRLPTLTALAEAGQCQWNSSSVFPSITPAATGSIVSGCYPAQHGIGGAYWYVPESGDVEYFGDDVWVVASEGFADYFNGFQWRLNYERFRARTLYELVEEHGLTSACLNYMWFKGPVEHEMEVPFPLRFMPGIPATTKIYGPTYLALGDFVHSKLPGSDKRFENSSGMLARWGFQDDATSRFLLQLADQSEFPDFTLAYFPDNDFRSHDEGPDNAIAAVIDVDETLGRFIDCCGGIIDFLDRFAIVVTGDHSQLHLRDDGTAAVDLAEILEEFSITPAGASWDSDDDLMICPNMRAAEVYLRPGAARQRQQILESLLACEKIDQICWKENTDRPLRFCVRTADRGELKFWPAEADDPSATADAHGLRWNWAGDLATIDAETDGSGGLTYGDYPNAMERIANAFTDPVDSLWVTAQPGYEFRLPSMKTNNRGSHGSLHRLDSLSPLLTAGLPEGVESPHQPRIVDVAPLCLAALGIESHAIETSRR